MGVLDELAQARANYERGDWVAALDTWSGVDRDALAGADLWPAAQAAHLLGRHHDAVDLLQRAFRLSVDQGDPAGAVRHAFFLSMILATCGEPALAAGWAARASALLAELPADAVEHGYVAFLQMFAHVAAGEWLEAGSAAERAASYGRTHRDADLLALGLVSSGRVAIYSGRVSEGLARLDEAMAGVTAGEVIPVVLGNVYCTAIEGCQEIGDVDRMAEWTSALHRWCAAQPGLVGFTGQCSVHRGQIMRRRGAWRDALDEFETAIERYRLNGTPDAIGLAEAERGDVLALQGDYAAAEAAYERAGEHGHDPQPGLALLWLARGRRDAAAAAMRRLMTETRGPVGQCRVLPSAVEVLLAVGAVDEATKIAADLNRLAGEVRSVPVLAAAASASGAVELAAGDAAGALPYLRKARQLWARADNPFEVGRVRQLTGVALAALGDVESGRRELRHAQDVFTALGARPAAGEVARLLAPADLPAGLTAREVEVLRLVAAGRSNVQIAAELVLSEKTVARHLSNIFGKLRVGSRTAAAAYAFEHGLA